MTNIIKRIDETTVQLIGFNGIDTQMDVFFCGEVGIIVADRLDIPGGTFMRGWRHTILPGKICKTAHELAAECEHLGGDISCMYDEASKSYSFLRRNFEKGKDITTRVPF